MTKNLPDFKHERQLIERGVGLIAGLDEVGRGSLAGPVVAGCVLFSKPLDVFSVPVKINDSKKLKHQERELAAKWIVKNAITSIGSSSVEEINSLGIVNACHLAFRRSIAKISKIMPPDHLLVDAFYIPKVKNFGKDKQTPIIKGDTISFSIAAASIVAKVYRDKLMVDYSRNKEYSVYDWQKNKGYGTKKHREAIAKFGITTLHRKLFVGRITSLI